MDILSQDIMYLPGVGPQRKEILSKELGISTWRDLIENFPYKYVDRSRIYTIRELSADMPSRSRSRMEIPSCTHRRRNKGVVISRSIA